MPTAHRCTNALCIVNFIKLPCLQRHQDMGAEWSTMLCSTGHAGCTPVSGHSPPQTMATNAWQQSAMLYTLTRKRLTFNTPKHTDAYRARISEHSYTKLRQLNIKASSVSSTLRTASYTSRLQTHIFLCWHRCQDKCFSCLFLMVTLNISTTRSYSSHFLLISRYVAGCTSSLIWYLGRYPFSSATLKLSYGTTLRKPTDNPMLWCPHSKTSKVNNCRAPMPVSKEACLSASGHSQPSHHHCCCCLGPGTCPNAEQHCQGWPAHHRHAPGESIAHSPLLTSFQTVQAQKLPGSHKGSLK